MDAEPASDRYRPLVLAGMLLASLAVIAACSRTHTPPPTPTVKHQSAPADTSGLSLDAPVPVDSHAVEDSRLIGYWEHHNPQGDISLEFLTNKRMVFAGREATYALVDSTLRVKDELGYTEYQYHMHGDSLVLDLVDGAHPHAELGFARVSLTPKDPAKR